MEMTFEQAMRPGLLQAFANRRGSGYMMRSEKRSGSYGNGSNHRPPKRKKAGFVYIFFTLLISLILWPVGMVMLWRRKVRLQAGTKLLISLLTLCLSVFLIVFALMVPVDNPEYTAFQDRANDWLDKAAVDVAAAGDAAYKKSTETWQVMSDFTEAGSDFALLQSADALDKGVELAGQARASIEDLLHREPAEPEATEVPADTEDPDATDAPADTEAPAYTDAPEATEAPAEVEATEPAEATDDIDIHLPEEAPAEEDAQALSAGILHADGSFEAGVEAPVEATEAPSEPTEAPVETAEAPVEATEASAEATEAPAEAETAEPAAETTEASVEATGAPVEATEAPVEATEAPVEATEAPAETTEPPAAVAQVKPASEATVYYYEDGSKGFHIGPTRHGMGNAPAHTLAEAFADGKNPCTSCGMPDESILTEAHIAWVDENNLIHTTDECAAFTGEWRLLPLAEAVDAGYAACADCGANAYVESIYPAPTPTPEPEVVTPSAALKSVGELTVYYYDSSVGYHVSPSCVGMSNAPAHTLAEAVSMGKHACGNCNPPSAELIGLPVLWLDDTGLCHTSDECASFSGKYTLITRDDALAQGLAGCPDCGAGEYLVPGTALAEN